MPFLSHLTSCTPTKSNLHLANSLATVVSEPALYTPNIPGTESHVPFQLLRSHQSIIPGPRHVFMFCNKASFYVQELSALRSTPQLEDHPLSAVCDCLFNIFAATLSIGGCSSHPHLLVGLNLSLSTSNLLMWQVWGSHNSDLFYGMRQLFSDYWHHTLELYIISQYHNFNFTLFLSNQADHKIGIVIHVKWNITHFCSTLEIKSEHKFTLPCLTLPHKEYTMASYTLM